MFNSDSTYGDEERLRRLVQKLSRNQTDIVRLWGRVGQGPDVIGANLSGLETPGFAFTPAMAPTTTAAPTTTTTTTPAPIVDYLYPVWDRDTSNVNFSSGSVAWSLLDDRGGDWPDHADYISIDESVVGSLGVWIDSIFPFSSLLSVELQLYVKNENGSVPLEFSAQILGDDEVTHLTDLVAIGGVGTGESSYSLRTATFTLEPEAQEWSYWTRPRLNLTVENDTDAGTPQLFISAVRVKPTYIPLF